MGTNLSGKDIEKWYQVLNNLGTDNKTSMLQDIESGRKTEVDMFAGTVCKLGEKYNVDTPANKIFYNIIKVLEAAKDK